MSDLISRKALLEAFDNYGFNQETMIPTISLMKVLEIIDNQPTAHDVDKVVEQIEEKMIDIVTDGDATALHHWNNALDTTIEIVKGGGVDE